jgi:hypothetical protein
VPNFVTPFLFPRSASQYAALLAAMAAKAGAGEPLSAAMLAQALSAALALAELLAAQPAAAASDIWVPDTRGAQPCMRQQSQGVATGHTSQRCRRHRRSSRAGTGIQLVLAQATTRGSQLAAAT